MKLRSRVVMITVLVFLLVQSTLVWSAGLPVAKPEDVGMSSQRLERLGVVLQADIEQGKIPGAVVLVARRGKIAYFESFGMRDKEAASPMAKDAIFRIYSMTKPIVSVGAVLLNQEGKLFFADPVSKYIPELGKLKVCAEITDPKTGEAGCNDVPAVRDMTIQDLLRHTSGLTYGFFGKSAVKEMYKKSGIENQEEPLPEMITKIGKLPLAYQPGTTWDYSRSTDVLGRVIEVASGMPLDRFIEERITRPLKMEDTAFFVKPEKQNRIAAGQKDPKTGRAPYLGDVTKPPKMLSGGGGLVASTMDYARFLQMLLNGGEFDGTRLLNRKIIEYMTADHLGTAVKPGPIYLPGAGYGFGLGFAVRLQDGVAAWPGTTGDYYWDGYAGTTFWVDPKEQLLAILMIQEPSQRLNYRYLLRSIVYQAILN
jgi:CubicO group peptidase (beta-lactamase class C family)